jgi:hypothetical protein
VAVLDSTATAVPLTGQDTPPAGTRAVGLEVRHAARTHGDAGATLPSTRAPRCSRAASAVTADTILEDLYARI